MTQRPQIPLWFFSLLMALFTLTAAVFLYLGTWLAETRYLPREEAKTMSLVYRQIEKSYYKDISEAKGQAMMVEAIKGMVGTLDRYSRFIPEEESRQFDENTSGIYHGIGALMQGVGSDIIVMYPYPGSPAESAGLQPGDKLVRVNGQSTADVEEPRISNTVKLVKGPAGTQVELVLARGDEEVTVEVKRRPVAQPSIRWARMQDKEKGVGYVYLSDFVDKSCEEFEAAIEELRKESDNNLKGLILDLRGNTGGGLKVCLCLTNQFLSKGTIVTLMRRGDILEKSFAADPAKCKLPEIPLVVMINGRSASASEVLSGALQDQERARIVGTRSYGKGLVQSIFQWTNLPIRLKLTTSEYRTPNNRNIHNERRHGGDQNASRGGIEPDITIKLTKEKRQAIQVGLKAFEIPKRYIADVEKLAEKLKVPLERPLSADQDPQLAAAIEECRRLIAGTGKEPEPQSKGKQGPRKQAGK